MLKNRKSICSKFLMLYLFLFFVYGDKLVVVAIYVDWKYIVLEFLKYVVIRNM